MAPRRFSRNEIDLMVASLLGVNPVKECSTDLRHSRYLRSNITESAGTR